MKKFYVFLTAIAVVLFGLFGSSNISLAQGVAPKTNWRAMHFTSEEEFLAHQRGERSGKSVVETDPPTGTVRFPAEFEKMQGVIISYPDEFGIPTDVIASLSQDVKVYILCPAAYQTYAQRELRSVSGLVQDNIVYVTADVDSYWTRDFGPWYMFSDTDPGIVDFVYNRNRPNDEVIPGVMSAYQNIPMYGMNLTHTGGNMMQDGRGVGYSDDLVITENGNDETNVRNKMRSYLGIDPYNITINPRTDYIAHIDCWGKLLAPDKILIARVPESDSQYDEYEEVASYFANTNCSYGYPYTVYRVNEFGSGDDAALSPYTNSLIVNNKVFVPMGSNTAYNNAAVAVYEEAMPGYTIVPVNSPSVSSGIDWLNSDAIHCRARGIMDFNMLFVDHRNVIHNGSTGYAPYQMNYTVNADIIAYSDAAITEANLVYRYNGGEWNTIAMTHVAGNQYVANIPGDFARQYEYYITATDALGNTGSQPMMGALDPHTFTVPACLGVSAEFEAEMLQQIKGEPIQFHDKSQSDGPIYAWAWTFIAPDGSTITSTEQNPFVAFDQIGTYDVTLTATGATGSGTLTKEDYITITDGQLSFNMGDASQMTGNHIRFYDSGGPGDCYRNNENYTVTFYPIMPGGMMQVTFDRFDVENRYDYLFVYDGTSIAAPLIGKYCGLSLPPTIIASNEQGALTFRFYSDNSVTSIGWSASVDCIVYDYYDIHVCDNMQGGTITADCTKQRAGQTVTLTATPYGQSQLFSVSVTDEYGYEIRVEDMQFTMPESEVTICAVFDVFDVILMDNGSQQTPRALFYDHGGPNSNYANNENYVLTLYPQDNNHVLQVEFTDFYVENNWDKLYIYDGEAVQGTPVKTLTGKLRAETIGVIRATNPAGALTFQFQSDYSTTKFGWEAEITSVEDTPRYIYYIDNNTGDQNYLEGPAIAHGQSTVTLTVHTDATHVLEDAKLINLGEYDLDYYMSHPSGFTYSYLPVGDNTITFTMPDYNVAVEPLFREGHYENEYTLVTNIADLSAGGKYIIANTNVDGAAFAMSEQKNVNTADAHRAAVPVTVEDNKIIVSAAAEDKVKEFGFEGSSTRMTVIDPTFSDQFGDRGYLYVFRGVNSEGTSFVYALSTTTYSSYRYWRVNVGSNGAATLCGTSWAYYMHYNDATERFDVSNASSNVYIYKWSGLRFVEGSKEVCDAVNEMETAANIYPNPTQDNVVIEAEGMNHVSVYTLTGQRVYDEDVNASQMSLNMAQFGNGMYIVRIITNNGTAVKRVVVE